MGADLARVKGSGPKRPYC
ncbi:MAG: hypothetical protein MH219_12970 [Marinobacter sp.]|nr:hypothetical protein [Marinobacter sp.]